MRLSLKSVIESVVGLGKRQGTDMNVESLPSTGILLLAQGSYKRQCERWFYRTRGVNDDIDWSSLAGLADLVHGHRKCHTFVVQQASGHSLFVV